MMNGDVVDAVHWHPGAAVTVTNPSFISAEAFAPEGNNITPQFCGACPPAWVTGTRNPPTVSVAERATPGSGATEILRVPPPTPDAALVIVRKESLLVAVQLQPFPVNTVSVSVPPLEPIDNDCGKTVN